jgi:hypothetical protein
MLALSAVMYYIKAFPPPEGRTGKKDFEKKTIKIKDKG